MTSKVDECPLFDDRLRITMESISPIHAASHARMQISCYILRYNIVFVAQALLVARSVGIAVGKVARFNEIRNSCTWDAYMQTKLIHAEF